jgi:hypothetical protein
MIKHGRTAADLRKFTQEVLVYILFESSFIVTEYF